MARPGAQGMPPQTRPIMNDAHGFLLNLALVLCAAAVTTVVFQRLRQPVVLGYLLAGMIISPHTPIPLVADEATVHALSELGVILLMFSLGLEFRLERLFRVGPTAGLIAIIQSSLMIWLGYQAGQLFGWTVRESIYAGALIAISSTTIIVKVFAERGIRGKLADLVFGVLIVEDLIAIVLMALLTTISTGDVLSVGGMATTAARLAAFLAGLLVVGLLFIPRLIRAVIRLDRNETTVVASIGICFAAALAAYSFGYSVALGAFLAGSMVAESGEAATVEHLVQPICDLFAAIFFVSVGMLIDPRLVAEHWAAVLVFTAVVVFGKVTGVMVGSFLTGQGIRTSVQAGMSLAQIGEFSFIIAALGLSTKATGAFLYPVAVAVSAITTLVTPWLIGLSDPLATYIDRHLPKPLQAFVTLYGSWLEGLRRVPSAAGERARLRQVLSALLFDVALLVGIIFTAAVQGDAGLGWLLGSGVPEGYGRVVMVALTAALSAPFVIGIVRCAHALGLVLGGMALPHTKTGRVDFAEAPRRVLAGTIQLGVILLVGVPLVAVTQPFLPNLSGVVILVVTLLVFGVSFWRSAKSLQGHTRAGAQVIVEALMQQARGARHSDEAASLAPLHDLLPGLGTPVPIPLTIGSYAVGRTLAELNLRGLTTASVLAIVRDGGAVTVPTGKEALRQGDVLAVAGTAEAIAAARQLLLQGQAG